MLSISKAVKNKPQQKELSAAVKRQSHKRELTAAEKKKPKKKELAVAVKKQLKKKETPVVEKKPSKKKELSAAVKTQPKKSKRAAPVKKQPNKEEPAAAEKKPSQKSKLTGAVKDQPQKKMLSLEDLGTRYKCYKCGTKFYDLSRPEPLCPSCGVNQNDDEAKRSHKRKRSRRSYSMTKAVPTIIAPEERDDESEVVNEVDAEYSLDMDDIVLDEHTDNE
jgi:uncharacterized protein (TIGR02300 family)